MGKSDWPLLKPAETCGAKPRRHCSPSRPSILLTSADDAQIPTPTRVEQCTIICIYIQTLSARSGIWDWFVFASLQNSHSLCGSPWNLHKNLSRTHSQHCHTKKALLCFSSSTSESFYQARSYYWVQIVWQCCGLQLHSAWQCYCRGQTYSLG